MNGRAPPAEKFVAASDGGGGGGGGGGESTGGHFLFGCCDTRESGARCQVLDIVI